MIWIFVCFCLKMQVSDIAWPNAASICLFPQTQQKPNQDLATMGQLLLPHMAWRRHRHGRAAHSEIKQILTVAAVASER